MLHFFTANKDGCVCTHESVCAWKMNHDCLWCESFAFRPQDGERILPLFDICDDLWWRLMRVSCGCISRSSSKLTASGVGDVMNTTPVNEQWRKELRGSCGGCCRGFTGLLRCAKFTSVDDYLLIISLRSLVGGAKCFNLSQEAIYCNLCSFFWAICGGFPILDAEWHSIEK